MRKGGGRGYYRDCWTEPRPGKRVAKVRDLLVANAMEIDELAEVCGTTRSGIHMILKNLEIFCGYLIQSWPSPNSGWRYAVKVYRITGRLSWTGGVSEDYTIPKGE